MDIDLVNNLEGSDDEDEIQLTPAEVIELMEEAWINEKFAPEILPHKAEIVDCLLGQISYMESNIQSLESRDFKKSIHLLEVDRLHFLISSYLRMRLEKIETYVVHILEQENERIQQGVDLYLTEQELKFAKEFSEGLQQHFENISSFYPRLPRDEWNQATVKPNIHNFVFLKSKSDIDDVVIDDGKNVQNDLVYLNRGSQVIISYKSVATLVKRGDVQLI
ncbi:DNA replication complex GINS protein SLD5-like [Anoplophora glabripennis]|uniref:DNA replication complex GINS protein SLD5 n=1 Tax=Anoplophora glabripennis TaxID=217634 RepID=UPI000874503C|nr:DNA replication complex GINS protein SLD5 [Anoplophora glabripennis]XP_023312369.1 DNA replication complex GINS protein SLD5-like [Anoplophora glabripennis]